MKNNRYLKEIFAVNQKQDPVIDAVRALSVLSIIAFHVVVGILQIFDFEKSKQYILSMPLVLQPLWQGEKGVDAFFLISALVLGIPAFNKIESFGWSATKDFYRKRFFRIYPLFLLALIIYTFGQWSYFGKYFFSNLFLINNFIPGERTIIPVGWSLLVEVQYYAVLPILLYVIKKTAHRFSALTLIALSSMLACAWRLTNHPELYKRPITDIFLASDHSGFARLIGENLYESNLTRFGPFAIGLLIAYLKVKKEDVLKRFFSTSIASLFVFVLGLCLVFLGIGIPMYDPQSFYYNPFSETLNFMVMISHRQVFAIGLALLILGCWYSSERYFSWLTKIAGFRVWLPISRLSFPIYLFHFPFIAVAAVAVFGTTDVKTIQTVSFLQGGSIFVLASILTIIFSIPLYVYIERPLIERGRAKSL